jgi:hypothetical protein
VKPLNPNKVNQILDEDGYGYYDPPLYPMPVQTLKGRPNYGEQPQEGTKKAKKNNKKAKKSRLGEKKTEKQYKSSYYKSETKVPKNHGNY